MIESVNIRSTAFYCLICRQYALIFVKNLSRKNKEERKKVALKTRTDMAAGKYSVKCSFDDAINKKTYTKEKIHVLDQPTISDISPNETAVNTETNVTITGSGFVNSSALMCVLCPEKEKKVERFKAIFINATTIICQLRPAPRAKHSKISLLFASGAVNEKLARAIAMKFSFYDRVPEPLKCEFSASFRFIFVYFNKPVDCNGECESFIKGTALNKLTKKSKCRCQRNMMIILQENSKLRPGDEMKLALGNFQSNRSPYTNHFSTVEIRMLTCNSDPASKPFELEISAPELIGEYKQNTHTNTTGSG